MTTRVLFVCIHNSARSQMAEAFLNARGGEGFIADSAGLEPGTLNPVVVAAMAERGFDLSGRQTTSVAQVLARGTAYDCVITVCDEANAERCPVFPGAVERLHWGFPDPSALRGSSAEKLAGTREIRDRIERRIEQWCAERRRPG